MTIPIMAYKKHYSTFILFSIIDFSNIINICDNTKIIKREIKKRYQKETIDNSTARH